MEEPTRLATRTVALGGRTVRWRFAGEGPPLVCVHGLAGSWRWWRAVLPQLAAHRQVHLVDLPRFSALARFRPGDAADWLCRWLEAAGLERPALVGHSLGGLLAAQVAARTELERLVLVAPAGVPAGRGVAGELLGLLSALRTTRPAFLPTIVADALRWGPESIVRGGVYAAGVDLRPELGRIGVPTLLVWGERDELVPVRTAPAWRDAIAGARLVVLPGAGHVPMVEAPAAFADAVLAFLAEEAPRR